MTLYYFENEKNVSEWLNHVNNSDQIVVITETTVAAYYLSALKKLLLPRDNAIHYCIVPAGEENKSRETKQSIEDQLLAAGCGRDTIIIALGGGMITDLAGYVAATYARGIPVIYIPTTLLAMVDAAIGGKNGVNTPQGKNLIGTIRDPLAIIIQPAYLQTLSQSDYLFALTEVIKHALLVDADLFSWLYDNVELICERESKTVLNMIQRSIHIKKQITEKDKNEKGIRTILNLGHTVAHALETASDYQINHGEAVGIGLLIEIRLAECKGFISNTAVMALKNLYHKYNLIFTLKDKINLDSLKTAFHFDKKKRNGIIHCVMLADIGSVYSHEGVYAMPMDSEDIDCMLAFLKEEYDV